MNYKDRFWIKIEKTDSCWIWTAGTNSWGYGRMKTINNKQELAHRISWRLRFGEIPVGQFVLHKCDNRLCVNPDHLFLGSQKDNVRDMWSKGRQGNVVNHGSKNNNSKLSEESVIQIRAMKDMDLKQRDIAAVFGVDESVVSNIVKRKRWKHI